jgi:transposase
MYSTNLTDSQWQGISIFFDLKRKRAFNLRDIVNAMLYISKTGVQWKMLPNDFPPYGTVFYYFKKWKKNGLWRKISQYTTKLARVKMGYSPEMLTLIIDSQSIKNSERGVIDKGFDGHKKIQGRKRTVSTDSIGHIVDCVVGPANEHDLPAAKRLIEKLKTFGMSALKYIVADGAYRGLETWAREKYGIEVQISKQIKEKKFTPIALRWKVERSISWLMWSRRLSRDYEANTDSSEAWVLIAGIRNTLKYL